MTKKTLYIDLDNTLVNFEARIEGIDPSVLARYEGRNDEIPRIFAVMPPVAGAIDAYRELAEISDTYILTTQT